MFQSAASLTKQNKKRKMRKERRRNAACAEYAKFPEIRDPIHQWRDPSSNPNQSKRNQVRRQCPGVSEGFNQVNNTTPLLVEPILKFPANMIGSEDFQQVNNKKPFPVEPIRKFPANMKVERLGQFPDLIIMNFHKGKILTGLSLLQKGFADSPYGPLRVQTIDQGFYIKSKLFCDGVCLAEEEGKKKLEAETKVAYSLIQKLRSTNYFIEVRPSYFPKKKYRCPDFILNPDPSQSHIYKVVCLKEPFGQPFIYPLSGAVHYVSSEDELWEYIQNHGNSESRADLFILNIYKSKFKKSKEVCRISNLEWMQLLGCSNRGCVAIREVKPRQVLLDLIQGGGENIKYRLLIPGSDLDAEIKVDESDSDESVHFDGQEHPQPVFPNKECERLSAAQETVNVQPLRDVSFFSHNLGALSSTSFRPNPFFSGNSGNLPLQAPETSFSQMAGAFSKSNSASSFQAPTKFSAQEGNSFHPQNVRNIPSEIQSTFSSLALEAQNSGTSLFKTQETLFPNISLTNNNSQEFERQNRGEITPRKEENIEIAPWIQDNLILMDVFNEKSELATPKEIVSYAVRVSPNLEEFIIEKKLDNRTGEIKAEVLIDKRLVGRAFAYSEEEVKRLAAANALENLKKCCIYLEVKKSYVGSFQEWPEFFKGKLPGYQNKYCRITDQSRIPKNNVLQLIHLCLKTKFQDFIFLDDFPLDLKEKIVDGAKKKKQMVRWFAKECVCISRRIKPAQVYHDMIRCNETENEKYMLFTPPGKLNAVVPQLPPTDEGIKNLFDFQDKYSAKDQKDQLDLKIGTGFHGLFDNQLKNTFPVQSEQQVQMSVNNQSNVEGERKEPSWSEPNNKRSYSHITNDEYEPYGSKRFASSAYSFEHKDETEQYFPKNCIVENEVFNMESNNQRNLRGKITSWNRNNQQEDDRRQEMQLSALGSSSQEALLRQESNRGPKESSWDERTNFRGSSSTEFSESSNRVSGRQNDMEQNSFRLDRRDKDRNEPSRQRLSDMVKDRQEPGRSTLDAGRIRSREANTHSFPRDNREQSSSRRPREHDSSDNFKRRSDSDYNRLRDSREGSSSNSQRRSQFRDSKSRERNREGTTGLDNRQKNRSEPDRLWTRDVKRSYDQRL